MTRLADFIYPPEHDALVLRALGLILSGAVILGALAFWTLDKIGA